MTNVVTERRVMVEKQFELPVGTASGSSDTTSKHSRARMSREESLTRWIPVFVSVGLFLVTTAIAQWAKRKDFNDEDIVCDDVGTGDDAVDIEELRRWYHSRRVHDRLSYENIQDSLMHHDNDSTLRRRTSKKAAQSSSPNLNLNLNEMFDPPSSASLSMNEDISEWDVQHRSRSKPASPPLESRDSNLQEMHPNADYDFHPKNRNWRHFEHFNEQDPRRDQLPSPPNGAQAAFQKLQQEAAARTTAHARMVDTDDEEDEEEDANSISSDGSESSEEQFVWMKHSHRSKSPTFSNDDSEDTWPKAIRKRVPSFLKLFMDSTTDEKNNVDDSVDSNIALETLPQAVLETSGTRQHEAKHTLSRHPIARRTVTSIESDYNSTEKSDVHKPKPVRRNSLPAAPSTATSEIAEMPTSFPLALQRMWSRRSSSSNDRPKKQVTRQSSSVTLPTSHHHHRQLRAQYNATIMPEKVILIRHGQSMGNIDELLYSTTPDNAMPLTQLGWEQAHAAGETLKNKILTPGESVHFIVSPYVRTVETFHGMVRAWCDPKDFSHITNKDKRIKAWYRQLMGMGLTWNEDSRIREQDFGNYQDPETIRKAKKERHRFGIFYYRFPHGESASDVFDRVSTFLDSLWRSFEMNKSQNYVLVTHGISIRVLLARYFRYTIDQFNILANPRNCEMVILGHNGQGRLELQGRCALDVGSGEDNGDENSKKDKDIHVTGYKFHKRLRILPKNAIRKVKIRISPDD